MRYRFSQDEERYLASGVNAFLSKPIDHDSLLAKIATRLQLPLIYEHFNVESMLGESVIDALVVPPNEQIEALYRLARLGNMEDVLRWSNRLDALDERYWQFADQLRALAKGYQSKAILNFAKRYYLDETETSLDHDTSTLDRK